MWEKNPWAGFNYTFGPQTINLPLPALPGNHQLENAGTALAALAKLPGFKVTPEHIAAGLKSVKWLARLQQLTSGKLAALLPKNSELWLDGGHNQQGGEILRGWLEGKKSGSSFPIYIICGMLQDKEAEAFIRNFSGLADKLFAVPVPGEGKSGHPWRSLKSGKNPL